MQSLSYSYPVYTSPGSSPFKSKIKTGIASIQTGKLQPAIVRGEKNAANAGREVQVKSLLPGFSLQNTNNGRTIAKPDELEIKRSAQTKSTKIQSARGNRIELN